MKMKRILAGAPLLATLLIAPAVQAGALTQLYFDDARTTYSSGESFSIDLLADISPLDMAWAYSFDLSFDNGASYVGAPGSGTYLVFDSFTPNITLFDSPLPPLFDDGDGIAAETDLPPSPVPLPPTGVSGSGVLLGTFNFHHHGGPIGDETLYLGLSDPDFLYGPDVGLAPVYYPPYMPNNPTLTLTALQDTGPGPDNEPVPEPATMLLLGTGLAGLAGARRRSNKA